MIRMQFVMGRGWTSKVISWYSAGHFSHVDAVLPDGRLLGSRSDDPDGSGRGVRIRPPYYEDWEQRVVMTLATNAGRTRAFYDWLVTQLGAPYDHTAIWGFVTGRDWRSADSWFCSELISAGLEISGASPDLYAPRNKVTPAALATVMSALGAVVT